MRWFSRRLPLPEYTQTAIIAVLCGGRGQRLSYPAHVQTVGLTADVVVKSSFISHYGHRADFLPFASHGVFRPAHAVHLRTFCANGEEKYCDMRGGQSVAISQRPHITAPHGRRQTSREINRPVKKTTSRCCDARVIIHEHAHCRHSGHSHFFPAIFPRSL